MKKAIAIVAVLALIFISGCGSNQKNSPSNVDFSSLQIVDKTVQLNTFNIDDYMTSSTKVEKVESIYSRRNPSGAYESVENLYNDNNANMSRAMAYGKILKIENYDADGWGGYMLTFLVGKAYKGDVNPGEKITIVTSGGYLRLLKNIEDLGGEDKLGRSEKEIENVILDNSGPDPKLKEGDELLVTLAVDPGMPEGVWSEQKHMGRFYYNEKGLLTRYKYDDLSFEEYDEKTRKSKTYQQEFTFEELDKKLEDLKKTAKK